MKKIEKGKVSEIIRGVMMLRKTYCCLWRPCCDKTNTLPTVSYCNHENNREDKDCRKKWIWTSYILTSDYDFVSTALLSLGTNELIQKESKKGCIQRRDMCVSLHLISLIASVEAQ